MPKDDLALQSVHREYVECADYDIVCDVERARRFAVATRRLIGFAASSSNEASSMTFDLGLLQGQLNAALAYIRANDTSGQPITTNPDGTVDDGETRCFGFGGYQRQFGGFRR